MLYPEIVINSILNIFFLNDLFSLLIIIISIFLFYRLWIKFSTKIKMYKYLIIGLRILILILIIPLVKNKLFIKEELIVKKQNIGVVIDNSMSIEKIMTLDTSLNINNIVAQVKAWADSNNMNLSWYNLDSVLNIDKLSFQRQNSSYDYLQEILISEDIDQLFLVSDGNLNQGSFSNNQYIDDKIKIHTIGLGSIADINQNIKINDVNIDFLNDSIIINSECWANINTENSIFAFNIFSDSLNRMIYSDTLKLNLGKYNFDKIASIPFSSVNKNISIDLEPINFLDQKLYDNKWNFNMVESNPKNILFLTGKLTYNTSFLKNIISNISNQHYVEHLVVIDDKNNLQINKNLDYYDYIIFDNFPSFDFHFDLVEKIYNLNIPIIFFEGYEFNDSYLNRILDMYYPNQFYFDEKIYINKYFNLGNGNDLGPVYSRYNLFYNDSKFLKINYFSNQIIYEIIDSKFSAFLVPNISEIDFSMRTNYNDDYIQKYIEYMFSNNLNNKEIINFKLKKNNYLLGENLLFEFDENKIPFDIVGYSLIINNINKNKVDSIDYSDNLNIYIDDSGEFEIYFLFKGTNGEIINSNIENFNVDMENIELDNISQNFKLLDDISSKSKGKYINAYNLNIDYFNSIDNDDIVSNYNNVYNVLDLFIKEKIYLLVIFLFVLEVYIRKRIGLL